MPVDDKLNTLLYEQKNLLQTILDIQNEIIIVINDESISECNRRFFEFFGVATINLFYEKHKNLTSLFLNREEMLYDFEEDTAFLKALIRNKKNKNESYVCMYDRQKEEERFFLVRYDYFPLIENGFVVTFKDMTENLRYEKMLEEKNKAQKELLIEQSKLASMGEMLATIAHQWRQPINAINIIIQNLDDLAEYGEATPESITKATKDILNQTSFMNQTIEDFRNFLRPDKIMHPFSAIDAITGIIAILNSTLKKVGVDITFIYDRGSDYTLLGVQNEFAQVMLNIIKNAQDVLVEKSVERGSIEIKTLAKDDAIIVSVQDNGGGIPQEYLPDKIFENSFTTKGKSGTGIGLYISKIIVEHNLKGRIEVRNHEGGALFTLTLPRYRPTDI